MSFKVFQLPTGMSQTQLLQIALTSKQPRKYAEPFLYGSRPLFTLCVGNTASSNAEKQNTDPSAVFN